MRRRKMDIRAIVMLLFGLVAVILIMLQLQQSTPKPPPELAKLEGQRIGIVDSVYINRPFQFLLRMPNAQWHPSILTFDTTAAWLSDELPLQSQILWLLSMTRQQHNKTVAVARLGIVRVDAEPVAKELAIDYLAEIIANFEQNNERVRIVQQVQTPAHVVLKGAYFIVVLPDAAVDMPVQIVALLPRNEFIYVISSETTEAAYPDYKNEIEEIVQRFYALPSNIP